MYGGRSLPYKNVRFGYSIYSPMKQQKSTFNSYNLFYDVILVQNMVNVFLNCTNFALMSAQEYVNEVEKTVLSGQPS